MAKTLIKVICPDCGKERFMTLGDLNRGRRKTKLCLPCYNHQKWLLPRSHKVKDIIHEGYILVYQPGHPRATNRDYVKRAVLVLERSLGRYLTHEENVHHINGIKDDDRIENLAIMTNGDHVRIHAKQRNHHAIHGQNGKFVNK